MSPEGPGDDDVLVAAARAGDRRALEPCWNGTPTASTPCADASSSTRTTRSTPPRRRCSPWPGASPASTAAARFTTWCYRIATNAALDEVRRARRRPVAVEPSPDVCRDPRDATMAVDARLDVDAALRTLTPEFRAAVVLRDLCDLDYAEIAEVLALPPGTVRSRIARGRAALVAALGEPSGNPATPTFVGTEEP